MPSARLDDCLLPGSTCTWNTWVLSDWVRHGVSPSPFKLRWGSLLGTWLFQRCQLSWHSAVHMMICQHLKRAMLYVLPNMFPHQTIIYFPSLSVSLPLLFPLILLRCLFCRRTHINLSTEWARLFIAMRHPYNRWASQQVTIYMYIYIRYMYLLVPVARLIDWVWVCLHD